MKVERGAAYLPCRLLEHLYSIYSSHTYSLLSVLLGSTSQLVSKSVFAQDDWDIYSFHINATVTHRYAVTTITSRIANRMNESKETEFQIQIPKNAFISMFRLTMDGQVYDGIVKTKEQAQEQYIRAVSHGQSAGIVSSVGRTLEEFKTSVTVAAHKKVTFELKYEELLKRTHGKYELQIHARPMQPVRDFKAWVHFYPTADQQKNCDSCGEEGMNGDLVIAYDVNRTSDGYFVHHFAPSSLPRIPKNVIFVIDQSGSMHGRKIKQTRTALLRILNDLAEDDFFGLISFDSQIIHWKRELVQATGPNLEGARQFVLNIHDRGSTNINAAVLEGARILNAHPRDGSASILILLTDGDPTSGVTNLDTIRSNVKQAVAGKFPLYCLGFGFDVNFEFLEKMSLQNSGAARRIYEDSDADLQLKGFYDEVATPLLTDVTMIYVGGTNLTQTNFSQYYNGSEIVVAGEIIDNNVENFTPQVHDLLSDIDEGGRSLSCSRRVAGLTLGPSVSVIVSLGKTLQPTCLQVVDRRTDGGCIAASPLSGDGGCIAASPVSGYGGCIAASPLSGCPRAAVATIQ
uniref:Inter-alpha-trypsin inhibitor heavy chain H3-like n=1 Tax=Poecilia reticulata TaxID=8081 RepID=A0A3P9NRE0_POERE